MFFATFFDPALRQPVNTLKMKYKDLLKHKKKSCQFFSTLFDIHGP